MAMHTPNASCESVMSLKPNCTLECTAGLKMAATHLPAERLQIALCNLQTFVLVMYLSWVHLSAVQKGPQAQALATGGN